MKGLNFSTRVPSFTIFCRSSFSFGQLSSKVFSASVPILVSVHDSPLAPVPASARVCLGLFHFTHISAHLCDCAVEGEAGAAAEEDAAVARPFGCLVNITTTAARWPLRMAATAAIISATVAPPPFSSQHGQTLEPLPGPGCCEAASRDLNSGNWVVNILKCSSAWVYFTPVIHYFQRAGCSCWTEDYCTYRNYFITVSRCCFCEAATFWS